MKGIIFMERNEKIHIQENINVVESLARSLGFPGLIKSNRNQMNSAVRQAISCYLKSLGYKEKNIAMMQQKSRTTIYYQIETFRKLLDVRDPLAVMLWQKLGM